MCSKTVKYTVIAIADLDFKGHNMRVFSLFGFIKGIFRANFNIKGIKSKGISKAVSFPHQHLKRRLVRLKKVNC